MKNKIVVREFDYIICNPDFKDSERYCYIEKADFILLSDFIKSYTSQNEDADILQFMKIGYKRGIGDYISIRNYVGVIQLRNGFQLEILPKITLGNGLEADNSVTKNIFLRMLRCLKDFKGLSFLNANLDSAKMNLYDIFIYMYICELRKLVKTGIKHSYINTEENLNHYKGKLNVVQNIKHNYAHKERFYCNFDEYGSDIPENRIIKTTLLRLKRISNNNNNDREIIKLLSYFESVNESYDYRMDLQRINMDRRTYKYKTILEWSEIFLSNKSFTTFTGSEDARALLFPMEKIYENYVARNLKSVFSRKDWKVSTQDRGRYLFVEPSRKFAIRPDIVIENGDTVVVLDTKWKRLIPDAHRNYGISQADMYQLYVYSKKYNAKNVWLLYPKDGKFDSDCNIRFTSDDETTINIFFVDLQEIEKSMEDLYETIIQTQKEVIQWHMERQ